MLRVARGLLVLFLSLTLNGCKEVILHELSESQANRVRVSLAQEGIRATKAREGKSWNLLVASEDAVDALRILEKTRLLAREPIIPEVVASGLLQGQDERMLLRERVISSTLQETLVQLPHVVDARVHLFLLPTQGLRLSQEEQSGRASVLLLVASGSQVDDGHVRRLISGAAGIKEEAVSVIVAEQLVEQHLEFDQGIYPSQSAAPAKRQLNLGLFIVGGCVVLFGAWCLLRRRRGRREVEISKLSPRDVSYEADFKHAERI